MKLLVNNVSKYSFLVALVRYAAKNNHQVLNCPPDLNLEETADRTAPDLVITTDEDHFTQETPRVHFGHNEVNCKRRIAPDISFADLLTYPGCISMSDFENDVLFSSNYEADGETLLKLDHLCNTSGLKIKCTGKSWLPSPSFVGFANEKEFIEEANKSKMVVTNDKIEQQSLLYRDILAVTLQEFDEKLLDPKKKTDFIQYKKNSETSQQFFTEMFKKIL